MTSRPSLSSRVALFIFSVVVALGLAEFGLRVIGFPMPRILTARDGKSYQMRPGGDFIYSGYLPGTFVDFNNHVVLNSRGYHDQEYAPQRPTTNTYRVMVLGDSYVAGLSVPTERIFHNQVEQMLNDQDPIRHDKYEVIALGRGNCAQVDEKEWLKADGPVYTPDLVLLVFFCGNDFMENSHDIKTRAANFARFYQTKIAPRKIAVFDRFLLIPHSRVNGLIAETAATWYAKHLHRFDSSISSADLVSPELGVYHVPRDSEWEMAFARTSDFLAEIQTACRNLHAQFALACLAGPQAIGELSQGMAESYEARGLDFHQPEKWVQSWCERNNVPFITLGPALAKAGKDKVFWRHDGHLNGYGNDVVADALYPFVVGVAQGDTNATAPSAAAPHT